MLKLGSLCTVFKVMYGKEYTGTGVYFEVHFNEYILEVFGNILI